jgi:hypothetical protein
MLKQKTILLLIILFMFGSSYAESNSINLPRQLFEKLIKAELPFNTLTIADVSFIREKPNLLSPIIATINMGSSVSVISYIKGNEIKYDEPNSFYAEYMEETDDWVQVYLENDDTDHIGGFLPLTSLPHLQIYSRFRAAKLYEEWIKRIPNELDMTDFICVVVISEQKNYVFYKGKIIYVTTVSTGSKTRYKGDRTMSQGVWRLGDRVEKDLIPLYGARLIYMEKYISRLKKFVKTKKAFHGTEEPNNLGRPTSMGCVYHHNNVIKKLYRLLPDKTLVITVAD